MPKIIAPQPPDLFARENNLHIISELGDNLERLNAAIDWTIFLPLLTELAFPNGTAGGDVGRPAYDPLFMFKILVLQKLHALSDHGAEFHIRDSERFKRFLGITVNDNVPDQTTIWRFREKIIGQDGFRRLFDLFKKFLKDHGLGVEEGKIVDASFTEVPKQRNTRQENEAIKAGQTPPEWEAQPDKAAQKDVDARWVKKGDLSYYGYKNHVKVDASSKLVVDYQVTDASVHDSQIFGVMIEPEDGVIYADSAYVGGKCEGELKEKGVEGEICERAYRNTPLTSKQKKKNRRRSRVRCRVEHVFGFMTGSMRAMFQRCVGLARNAGGIGLTNIIYNICRYEQIVRLKLKKYKRA